MSSCETDCALAPAPCWLLGPTVPGHAFVDLRYGHGLRQLTSFLCPPGSLPGWGQEDAGSPHLGPGISQAFLKCPQRAAGMEHADPSGVSPRLFATTTASDTLHGSCLVTSQSPSLDQKLHECRACLTYLQILCVWHDAGHVVVNKQVCPHRTKGPFLFPELSDSAPTLLTSPSFLWSTACRS